MLKLKTKTQFTAPTDRGSVITIVRLIIDKLEVDINNITPKGYYYYNDEEGKLVQKKINAMKLWQDVRTAEDSLPALESTSYLYDNIIQRLGEFTFLQLMIEAGVNFGTVSTDWEIDIE